MHWIRNAVCALLAALAPGALLAEEGSRQEPDYRIGVEDVLSISIWRARISTKW